MHYRVILPPPWVKIDCRSDVKAQLRPILDAAVARVPTPLPQGVSRDDVVRARARVEADLMRHAEEAARKGGVDYYFPSDLMHGVHLNSSFLVSVVMPDAMAGEDLIPKVHAHLLAEPGAEPVSIDDTIWVRESRVVERPADETMSEPLRVRRIDYRAPQPDDVRRWVLVSFTSLGDGEPESEFTDLTVDLFDAIMSTWRWQDHLTG